MTDYVCETFIGGVIHSMTFNNARNGVLTTFILLLSNFSNNQWAENIDGFYLRVY